MLVCENSSAIVTTSASFLLDNLDKRFPITENMIVATFLDPSMQKLPLLSTYCRTHEIDMCDLLIKKYVEYEPELKIEKSTKATPKNPSRSSTLRMELIQKHVAIDCSDEDGFESQVRQEYLKYTAVVDLVQDPLKWWKSHEAAFPYLSALARTMLSIPSSSGATEHHFSETGTFVNKKKANLDSLTFEKVMFIHDNFKHITDSVRV